MIPHCSFDLRFSDDIRFGTSFHMLICHLFIFFGKMSVKAFGLFFLLIKLFILLLSFKSCLHSLDSRLLSDVSFAKTFSQSVPFLLIAMILLFAEQFSSNFDETQLVNYFFHEL